MNKDNLDLLNNIKNKLKNNHVIKNLFKDFDIDISELDLYPVAFSDDLDVSARTDHGIIYINSKFIDDPAQIDHYLAHELTHTLQQCSGTHPTQGADDGFYLDNKYEQEGFQTQTEYMSDTRGDQVAEKYIDKVLDHHHVDNKKEREKRKNELLNLASLGK
jgi:hypothetical protein